MDVQFLHDLVVFEVTKNTVYASIFYKMSFNLSVMVVVLLKTATWRLHKSLVESGWVWLE